MSQRKPQSFDSKDKESYGAFSANSFVLLGVPDFRLLQRKLYLEVGLFLKTFLVAVGEYCFDYLVSSNHCLPFTGEFPKCSATYG